MRKLLLIFLLLPLFANAQWEFGLGAGISMNDVPSDIMYYKGDQQIPNYAFNTLLYYNLNYGFQTGLEVHVSELASVSSQTYPGVYTKEVGGDGKKFVYSKVTTGMCGVLNKNFIMGKSELYLGVAFGFGIARTSHTYAPDESYIAPDGGRGPIYGAQAGITINFSRMYAMNLEVAPRFYDFIYDAEAAYVKPTDYLHYTISAYTVTIGFRVRFPPPPDPDEVPRFDMDKYRRQRANW
jgi:hypothetical protein